MFKKSLLVVHAALLLMPLSFRAYAQEITEYGPPTGTLLIVGGGKLENTGILEEFIELAGGKDARIVIVPTAGGNRNADGSIKIYTEDDVLRPWRQRGLTHVQMLHTHDPKVADSEDFVNCLKEAKAVWFNGGRQWNLVDSYAGTLAYREFQKVLERGGVIGGSSAGATILGEFLVRGSILGSDIVIPPEREHQEAFNFLRKTAIDQHVDTRNRWDDLVPLIKWHPHLLGIGLSENTAIIVHGDRFDVIGSWKVVIHDNSRAYQPWEKPYYVLSAGDVYNMKTRRIDKVNVPPVNVR